MNYMIIVITVIEDELRASKKGVREQNIKAKTREKQLLKFKGEM